MMVPIEFWLATNQPNCQLQPPEQIHSWRGCQSWPCADSHEESIRAASKVQEWWQRAEISPVRDKIVLKRRDLVKSEDSGRLRTRWMMLLWYWHMCNAHTTSGSPPRPLGWIPRPSSSPLSPFLPALSSCPRPSSCCSTWPLPLTEYPHPPNYFLKHEPGSRSMSSLHWK